MGLYGSWKDCIYVSKHRNKEPLLVSLGGVGRERNASFSFIPLHIFLPMGCLDACVEQLA
jgi:hypothetical protein